MCFIILGIYYMYFNYPLNMYLGYSWKECSICNSYREYLKQRALDFNVLNYDKININKVNKRINLNK